MSEPGQQGVVWWVLKATLVFIFGPNLKTKILLRPRPELNNSTYIMVFLNHALACLRVVSVDWFDFLQIGLE